MKKKNTKKKAIKKKSPLMRINLLERRNKKLEKEIEDIKFHLDYISRRCRDPYEC